MIEVCSSVSGQLRGSARDINLAAIRASEALADNQPDAALDALNGLASHGDTEAMDGFYVVATRVFLALDEPWSALSCLSAAFSILNNDMGRLEEYCPGLARTTLERWLGSLPSRIKDEGLDLLRIGREGLEAASAKTILAKAPPLDTHSLANVDALLQAQQRAPYFVEVVAAWLLADADGRERPRLQRLAGNNLGVIWMLADALKRQGQLALAGQWQRLALEIAPNHSGANRHMAEILLLQGQADEAEPFARRAFELEPTTSHAALHARVREVMGDEASLYPLEVRRASSKQAGSTLVYDDGYRARIRLDRALVELFAAKRILSSDDAHQVRWREGVEIVLTRQIQAEMYSGFYHGSMLWTMGAFSYAMCELTQGIQVGRYCSIGSGFSVPSPRHPLEVVSTTPAFYGAGFHPRVAFCEDFNGIDLPLVSNPEKGGVVIENDVWIGADVAVMPGLRIGSGAVVAARSVVTKDVPCYSIVGGNPARVIRRRFPGEVCDALEASAWWQYGLHQLKAYSIADPARFAVEIADNPPAGPWNPGALTWADIEQLLH